MFDKDFVEEYFMLTKEKLGKIRIFEREIALPKRDMVSIVGPRRAGKTWLMFAHMDNKSLYLDFEHSAFEDIAHRDVFQIIELYSSLYERPEVLMLDEIQVVQNWQRLARSLHDSGFRVVMSGSSSKLLTREISTQLRGRATSVLLLPFSFREYLKVRGLDVRGIRGKVKAENEFKRYLKWGGYPEVVLDEANRERILRDYFDSIVYRDFVERFGISDIYMAKFMIEFLFRNFSREISLRKISNFLHNRLGRDVRPKVYENVWMVPETLSVFFLERYDKSVYKRKTGFKNYVCDLGFSTILGANNDIGFRVENAVFLDLLRMGNEKPGIQISYLKAKAGEVDFVVERKGKKVLMQVSYTDEPEAREFAALARSPITCHERILLTRSRRDVVEFEGKQIKLVPAVDFLLSPSLPI